MTSSTRGLFLYGAMALLLVLTGIFQSPDVALTILNVGLISAVMALGLNLQWGYAGLFNVGVMGFVALGGLAAVLVAVPPVEEAWSVATPAIVPTLLAFAGMIVSIIAIRRWTNGRTRTVLLNLVILGCLLAAIVFLSPTIEKIEDIDASRTGFLGGAGLPIIISWLVGAIFAGLAAWGIGKISLGLRSDYLAIATLGISEVIVIVMKNEDWLTRGVKNITGLPRPVAYEVDLQASAWMQQLAISLNVDAITLSSIIVKLSYTSLFLVIVLLVLLLNERVVKSPWGRMMRAIRDDEIAAQAYGKDIKSRHLQVFIVGSAIIGLAGAMLTTLDGQFTPGSYVPLRYTFIIWVMVIIGGSGNNYGAILGGIAIWFFWVQAEPVGRWLLDNLTLALDENGPLKRHLLASAGHVRMIAMGVILLLVLRFAPRGLIPSTD